MATKVSSSSRGWAAKVGLSALFLIPVVGLAVFGAHYYKEYQKLNKMTSDDFANRESDRVLSEVGKLYSLPKDEKPTVATVKDKSVLKKQSSFFDQAENKDSVVIYTKAKLAIIYRPSENRLVKVGPLDVQNTLAIKIIGSKDGRLAAAKILTDNKISASDGGDAKALYSDTTVVDLSGKNSEQAQQIADILKGKLATSLPDGEDKPAGIDVLVIVGLPAAP